MKCDRYEIENEAWKQLTKRDKRQRINKLVDVDSRGIVDGNSPLAALKGMISLVNSGEKGSANYLT